jgi:hypothetical protein
MENEKDEKTPHLDYGCTPFYMDEKFKIKRNKKSKFKKLKIKKQVWIGFEPPPSPNIFKLAMCYHCTQTL